MGKAAGELAQLLKLFGPVVAAFLNPADPCVKNEGKNRDYGQKSNNETGYELLHLYSLCLPISESNVHQYYYPVTVDFVDLVIARKPARSNVPSSVGGAVEWVAICYPSKVEAVAVPKHLTMAPTVSIVTGYYFVMA